jgi:hypothetical protein
MDEQGCILIGAPLQSIPGRMPRGGRCVAYRRIYDRTPGSFGKIMAWQLLKS